MSAPWEAKFLSCVDSSRLGQRGTRGLLSVGKSVIVSAYEGAVRPGGPQHGEK